MILSDYDETINSFSKVWESFPVVGSRPHKCRFMYYEFRDEPRLLATLAEEDSPNAAVHPAPLPAPVSTFLGWGQSDFMR
jgi:hypothetical protein